MMSPKSGEKGRGFMGRGLRLLFVCLCVLFWNAGQAFASTTTATFSGAGTAIDTIFGSGTCGVALAGEAHGTTVSGSGTFGALEGPRGGVCSPGTGAFRFRITSGSVTADHAHFKVSVFDSDSPTAPSGTTGEVDMDKPSQTITVNIGPFFGVFDSNPTLKFGFIDTEADVRITQRSDVVFVQRYSSTGVAADPAHPCALSVAGVRVLLAPAPIVDGGGNYLAGPRAGVSVCGVPAHLRLNVTNVETDGENIAIASVVATNTAAPPGTVTMDEPTQSIAFTDGRFNFFQRGATFLGVIRTEAAVDVDTDILGSTPGKVTGGGYILDHNNFSITADAKSVDDVKGEGHYQDKGAGLKFDSTDVTSLIITGNHATIRGHGTANGAPVDYRIDVDDAGEPGKSDRFAIQLSNGYTAGGVLGGGNIVIH